MAYSKDNVTGAAKELIEYAVNQNATIDEKTFLRYVENDGHFKGGVPAETLKEFTRRVEDFCKEMENDVKELRNRLYEIPEEATQ